MKTDIKYEMKQILRDWKRAVPFFLCAAVALLNIIIALFGRETHYYYYYDYYGEYYYYYREDVLNLVCYILPPVASAVLMMVHIVSKRDDLKSRVLLAVFYFFMAACQFFFGNIAIYWATIYDVLAVFVPTAALLAMIVLILTGNTKKWMYTAVSAAGLVLIAYSVWVFYKYRYRGDYYSQLIISECLSIILLYVVILIYENGMVTGKLNRPNKRLTAEEELTRLLAQRNDGTITEEEYEWRRAEIIRRL